MHNIRNKCPNCQDLKPFDSFNWETAQDPRDEYHPYIANITPVNKVKFGEIYQSVCCDSKWYLHGRIMYLVNPSRQIILDEWMSRDLRVTDRFQSVLASIGANPSGEYPCEVEFRDKTKNEFCFICLVTLPPDFEEAAWRVFTEEQPEKYSWIDEVVNIKKSRFALPLVVRKALSDFAAHQGERMYVRARIFDAHGRGFGIDPYQTFTNLKLDEPITVVDFYEVLAKNPGVVALDEVPVHTIIADPF